MNTVALLPAGVLVDDQELRMLKGHSRARPSVSPDGRFLAGGVRDDEARGWSVDAGALAHGTRAREAPEFGDAVGVSPR